MTKTFTQDDIIRYAYNEVSLEEKSEIQEALIHQPKLMKIYELIRSSMQALDGLSFSPSEASVRKVLQYSEGMQSSSCVN